MRFLITAGGTREYIDPVRFISNASSGRMGFSLTRAALQAGHKVILITTIENSKLKTQSSKLLKVIKVENAAEMFNVVKKYFLKCDCLIMAAAVADYTPIRTSKTKIKSGKKEFTIKLKPTVDILKWAALHKKSKIENLKSKMKRRRRLLVGFALEDKKLRANAERKLKEKKLDIIIANTPAAIGADKSTVQIKIRGRKWVRLAHATKTTIAKRIIREAESLKEINHRERGERRDERN